MSERESLFSFVVQERYLGPEGPGGWHDLRSWDTEDEAKAHIEALVGAVYDSAFRYVQREVTG